MNIMILFFISLFMIFLSSYLLSSVLDKKNCANGFIYLFLIIFSQIILTSEILSLFSALKPIPFLIFNIIFLLISILIHKKNNAGFWHIDLKLFFTRLFNTLKLDKTLIILLFGWLFFIIIALFSNTILPIMEVDAKSYHVLRSVEWVLAGNLNHFNTVDVRNIMFPINSEIIYSWIIMFTKKNIFLGYLSFFSYFLCLTCLYKIIHFIMGFSLRKTVWTLLIFSSFACVISEVSGSETNLLISSLLLATIYLFWNGIKNETGNTSVFMSALSCAIAIGTKTSAFFNIPAIGLFFLFLSYKNKKYKPFLKFLLFSFINTIIFSSYNYILNFIEFGNFFSTEGMYFTHVNNYGLKGVAANFIRNCFLLFDFSGFKFIEPLVNAILKLKLFLLDIVGVADIPIGLNTKDYNIYGINQSTVENLMGLGVLGFLLYIPSLIYSFIKFIFNKNDKTLFIFCFSVMLLISTMLMSYNLMHTTYGIRYFNTIILIYTPVIIYSYTKNNYNIVKYIFIGFALFYYIWLSLHLNTRPLEAIISDIIKNNTGIKEVRTKIYYVQYNKSKNSNPDEENYNIYRTLKNNFNSPKNKILMFPALSQYYILNLKLAALKNEFKLTTENISNINNINIEDYNILILPYDKREFYPYSSQTSNYIKPFSKKNTGNVENIKKLDMPLKDDNTNIQYSNDFACLYFDIYDVNVSEKDIPYSTTCIISNNYFKKHKFIPIFLFKHYAIYINTLNLPHTKRKY